MVKLYFIRHGKQDSSLCNVDVGLSREGKEQARLLAERLKNFQADALYSSDLIRAVETANILNQTLNLPHIIRREIREISFGHLEGLEEWEIEEQFSEFQKKQLLFNEDIPYPGGENGTAVYNRAISLINQIIRSGKQNIIIVTHGGTIRALLAGLFGKSQAERLSYAVSLENTSITEFCYSERYHRFYLERFNDFAHLEPFPELYRKSNKEEKY